MAQLHHACFYRGEKWSRGDDKDVETVTLKFDIGYYNDGKPPDMRRQLLILVSGGFFVQTMRDLAVVRRP